MPPRNSDFFTRGGTPRLRQLIEARAAGFPTKAQAADKLGLTPAELSNFASGARVPSPQKILNIVSNGPTPDQQQSDFPGLLDQSLIEGGHAPTFFRHILTTDKKMLALKREEGDFYSVEEMPLSDDILAAFSDLRFAGRKAALQIARIHEEAGGQSFVIETAYDDTDLADGEVAFCSLEDRFCFARIRRDHQGTKFIQIDPTTMRELQRGTGGSNLLEGKVGVLGRIVLQFNSVCSPPANRVECARVNSIRSLDKLRVGIAPFQDALLTMIGVELGFFEEEGLLVLPERVGWYDWPDFLHKGHEEVPCIVFSNIFTFVEKFAYTRDIRYLYGVNLFNRGFKLIEKRLSEATGERRDPAGPRILGDEEVMIEVATIGNSDWAAQLFSFCRAKQINLAYESARGIDSIYRAEHRKGRPTIVILDTTRQAGVENNPASIDHNYSVYLGSIPQRIRLLKDYKWSLVDGVELGPPYPVNGFVGSSKMLSDHLDIFLRFLRAWFRIANYIRPELELNSRPEWAADAQTGSRIVERAFEDDMFPDQIAKLRIDSSQRPTRNEIVEAWGEELIPCNPYEVEQEILGTNRNSPWKLDAQRAMEFISAFSLPDQKRKTKWTPLEEQLRSGAAASIDDPFALEFVHREYVSRYGSGEFRRTTEQLEQPPLPELLSVLKR